MFKDDLKEAMQKENLSIKDLSEYLGLSKGSVYNWMNGSVLPKKETLKSISELLNLSEKDYESEYLEVANRPTNKGGQRISFTFAGAKLREMRKDRGWSLDDFSKVTNLPKGSISKWESGVCNPSVPSLRTLCYFFGVNDDFFKLSNKESKEVKKEDKLVVILEERLETLSKKVQEYEKEVKELKDRISEIESKNNKQVYNIVSCPEQSKDNEIDIIAEFVKRLMSGKLASKGDII